MKTNELRIGNWINDIGGIPIEYSIGMICYVCELQKTFNIELPHKPIPLTEEWLVKFGFLFMVKTMELPALWIKGNIHLTQTESLDILFKGQHIKSVHQLQNLYFALTGEELTIKP